MAVGATDVFEAPAADAARKAGLFLAAAGACGVAASVILENGFVLAIFVGALIGSIDVLWLVRIIRRGVTLNSTQAARSVVRGYYLRFGITVAIFVVFIAKGVLGPVPLVVGFSVALFTLIGVMIYAAREEMLKDA